MIAKNSFTYIKPAFSRALITQDVLDLINHYKNKRPIQKNAVPIKYGEFNEVEYNVFSNGKVVVKFNGDTSFNWIPKYAVPTAYRQISFRIENAYDIYLIRVQPLVNISSAAQTKAYTYFTNKFDSDDSLNWPLEDVGPDCHEDNMGYWKGKPVVFDW